MKTRLAHMTLLLVLSAVGFLPAQEPKELRFANIFNSNMVLQQGKPAAVWGWAEPGAKLTVTIEEYDEPVKESGDLPVSIAYQEHNASTFQTQTIQAIAAKDGAWRATFPAMEASFRSKRIAVRDDQGKSTAIENVLIGEVWVCSGQSNMGWPGATNQDLWKNGLQLHGIRYTQYHYSWPRPRRDLPEKVDWEMISAKSIGGFAKVPYVFARNLHLNLGVPVGIINNSRGGTLGISWTSREELKAIEAPVVARQLAEYDAKAKEWETEEYLQRLAKAREDIVKVWRPRARKEIAAHWKQYDAFMKENLNAGKYAEWQEMAANWHEAMKLKHNLGPDALPDWKVWGLERHSTKLFKGTDIKPPVMDKALWKERPDDKDRREGWSPPAGLFNAGAVPLKGLAIAGMIFYQGENQNFGKLDTLEQYQYTFPTIISAHRKLFGNDELPFGIISLAGWGTRGGEPEHNAYSRWPYIMDIHRRTHRDTPNTGLIVIHDAGHASIHPPNKQPVGERAARWALATVYGKKIAHRGFRYQSSEIRDNRILVRFQADEEREKAIDEIYAEVEKKIRKGYPRFSEVLPVTVEGNANYRGFVIAGQDRRWYPAEARPNVKERALEVWSDLVKEPVAVRYAWAGFPDGNLGTRIAPVPTFRTDDWPYPELGQNGRRPDRMIQEQITERKIRTGLNELEKLTTKSSKEVKERLEALWKALYPEKEEEGE